MKQLALIFLALFALGISPALRADKRPAKTAAAAPAIQMKASNHKPQAPSAERARFLADNHISEHAAYSNPNLGKEIAGWITATAFLLLILGAFVYGVINWVPLRVGRRSEA